MNEVDPPRYGDVERCVARLRASMGKRVVTSTAVREHHGRDTTFHPVKPPDAVAFPASVEEVQHLCGPV